MVANLQAVATAGPELKELQRIFDAQRAAFGLVFDREAAAAAHRAAGKLFQPVLEQIHREESEDLRDADQAAGDAQQGGFHQAFIDLGHTGIVRALLAEPPAAAVGAAPDPPDGAAEPQAASSSPANMKKHRVIRIRRSIAASPKNIFLSD